MSSNEAIVKKFEALIEDGNRVLETAEAETVNFNAPDYSEDGFHIGFHQEQEQTGRKIVNKSAELMRFGTSSLSILQNYTGEDRSIYFLEFKKAWEILNSKSPIYTPDFQGIIGVLESAKREILEGFLLPYAIRVAAEVYGDLLDQAIYLFNKGFDIAAIAIGGAVLEDGERKIARRHNVSLPAGTTLIPISQELAKADVISSFEQKQIVARGDIRDKADHGNFQEFKEIPKNKKQEMLEGIRNYLAKYLS